MLAPLLVVALLAFPPGAPTPAPARPVPAALPFRLTAVQGRVEVLHPRGSWALGVAGRDLPAGSNLRTAPGARAALRVQTAPLHPAASLVLGASTELTLLDEPWDADIALRQGLIGIENPTPGPGIRIQLGRAVAATGGQAAIQADPGAGVPRRARLTALRGNSRVAIPQGTQRSVQEGQTLDLPAGGPSLWRLIPVDAEARLELRRRLGL